MEYLGKINKKAIIIITLVIILIIVGAICFTVMNKDKEETTNTNINEQTSQNTEDTNPQTFKEIQSYDIYYSVKGILNNYITMIKEANGDEYIDFGRLQQSRNEAISNLEKEAVDSIYNMFDKNYINECDITEETVYDLVQSYQKQGDYSENITYDLKIEEMYMLTLSENIDIILTNFKIDEMENTMMIKLDLNNNTYSIFGQEYVDLKQYSKDTEISDIEIDTNSIESNDYNNFNFINTDDKYIINQYFSEYQTKLLNNVNAAYELLDQEYRENKYENPEEFAEYVEQNYDALKSNYLTKYLINDFEEYKEYVCLDENNHYYIFIERSITDYSVVLDTYTIDLKDFTDKYNASDIPTKVGMNVEKVIAAINDKDYRYVYNKLDETYRNNNFGSLDNFKSYIEENFYENNEMEYLEFSEEGETYIYTAKIKNAQEENTGEKEITIVMQLLEGTDFVMSFSME